MPIIQSRSRIHPLDLNKNIKIGVAFPLDNTNMFSGTETVKEQLKANLLNLLLTYPGERVNLPTYGVGIKNLLFEQEIDLESLKEKIDNQISFYMPSIKLQDISVNLLENKHTIHISLIYLYLLDNNPQSILLKFK
tara:strand:- start:296 stop:703 length:408 start_codon:yes stop_codon:yes gene_type:complete